MNANNRFSNRRQTILSVQPRFANIDTNGRNSRWQHHIALTRHAFGIREFSFSTTGGSATVFQPTVVVLSTPKIHPKYCRRN